MKVAMSWGVWRNYINYKKRENIKAANFLGQNSLVFLVKFGWMHGEMLGSRVNSYEIFNFLSSFILFQTLVSHAVSRCQF